MRCGAPITRASSCSAIGGTPPPSPPPLFPHRPLPPPQPSPQPPRRGRDAAGGPLRCLSNALPPGPTPSSLGDEKAGRRLHPVTAGLSWPGGPSLSVSRSHHHRDALRPHLLQRPQGEPQSRL